MCTCACGNASPSPFLWRWVYVYWCFFGEMECICKFVATEKKAKIQCAFVSLCVEIYCTVLAPYGERMCVHKYVFVEIYCCVSL